MTLLVNRGKITVSFMKFEYKDERVHIPPSSYISGGTTLYINYHVNEPNDSTLQ